MVLSVGSRPYYKLLTAVLMVTLCGCTLSEFGRFPKAYPGPRPPVADVAELGQKDYSLNVPSYSIRNVDGNQMENATVIEILPGRHTIGTAVEWSNGFRDSNNLDFSAMAGKKYVVAIYELQPGEDPAKAEYREPSVVKAVALAPVRLAAMGATPIILFFTWPALVYIAAQERKKEPPKDRPFNGCCFVWIQDTDTGALVAGVSPKTPKGTSSATATPESPSGERDPRQMSSAFGFQTSP